MSNPLKIKQSAVWRTVRVLLFIWDVDYFIIKLIRLLTPGLTFSLTSFIVCTETSRPTSKAIYINGIAKSKKTAACSISIIITFPFRALEILTVINSDKFQNNFQQV